MKRVVFVVALGLLLCSCSNKVAKTEGKPYGVNMAFVPTSVPISRVYIIPIIPILRLPIWIIGMRRD